MQHSYGIRSRRDAYYYALRSYPSHCCSGLTTRAVVLSRITISLYDVFWPERAKRAPERAGASERGQAMKSIRYVISLFTEDIRQ